jgi:GT2 family glycosyltransferase
MTPVVDDPREVTSVSVGVIFHSGVEDLQNCLDSVARQTVACSVAVRDNSSFPQPVNELLRDRKDILLLRSGGNLGFAGGANDLIRSSASPLVLILNPDVKLAPDYVKVLISVMRANPRVGVVGGKLLRDDGLIDCTGVCFSRSRRPINRGEGDSDLGQFVAGEVFAMTGTAILLRRTMLQEVAPDGECFDSDFFVYREDTDLCCRAKSLGWKIWFEPTAVAVHRRAWRKGGRRQMSRAVRFHSFKNRYLEMVKNETWKSILVDLPWILIFEVAQLAYVLVREPFLLGGYVAAIKLFPKMLKKRRAMKLLR